LNKIKVLVVDDSALMRKIISDMINNEENMEVIDIARDGEDFLNKLSKINPDVITLDVEMPKIDGITALKEMKKKNINIPVIIISGISKKSAELTMECLEAGAFDFIPKPSGAISLDINKVKADLIEKINLAYEKNSNINLNSEMTKDICNNTDRKTTGKIKAVVIGASTGGPKALYSLITRLPENFAVPVFVVQHMPEGFTKAFAERLNSNSTIIVDEAHHLEEAEKGKVYIAPGGYHMEILKDKRIHLNRDPSVWGVRPSVDKLFSSAAEVYGENLLSVVLTGMGRDGANGTIDVKKNGGITMSEDKSTCTIYGMPKAAFETGMVDIVIPLDKIANEIISIVIEGEE
jgi:two-component system chemotaxis response regulator CheB